MDKQQIIDYVMNSPANTNKMVLSDMLDGITQGGGGSADVVSVKINRDENNNLVADMPHQDIYDAVLADKIVMLTRTDTHKNYFYVRTEEDEELTTLIFYSTPTIGESGSESEGVSADALAISLEDLPINDFRDRWDRYSLLGSPTILYLNSDLETGGFSISGISEDGEWDDNPTLYQVIDIFDSNIVSRIMVGGYGSDSWYTDLNYAFVPIAYDDNTNRIYFMAMQNNNGTVTTSYENIDLSNLPTEK